MNKYFRKNVLEKCIRKMYQKKIGLVNNVYIFFIFYFKGFKGLKD